MRAGVAEASCDESTEPEQKSERDGLKSRNAKNDANYGIIRRRVLHHGGGEGENGQGQAAHDGGRRYRQK